MGESKLSEVQRIAGRLTVVEHLYYSHPEQSAISFSPGFTRFLETQEQVYHRQFTATEAWTALECGWIKKPGQLLLINQEGKYRHKHPTNEQRQEDKLKIVEIGGHDSHCTWLVPPGESLRGLPKSLESLMIRCQHGAARCSLILFPE